MTGTFYGKKFGFEKSTTETDTLFADPEVNTVVIATQHDSHSKLVLNALKAGKNVFVEKPLALTGSEIDEIEATYLEITENGDRPKLMVGFNRRFAPHMQKLKAALNLVEPMAVTYTCNAGAIPTDSWIQDPERGGGRIIGEACHFIDIARFLVGSPIATTSVVAMKQNESKLQTFDTVSISLTFKNGSIATINYLANGNRAYPKERIEVFQSGSVAVLDNFVKLRGYGVKSFKTVRSIRQNKGINQCVKAFTKSIIAGGASPIPFEEILEVSRASVEAHKQLMPNNQT